MVSLRNEKGEIQHQAERLGISEIPIPPSSCLIPRKKMPMFTALKLSAPSLLKSRRLWRAALAGLVLVVAFWCVAPWFVKLPEGLLENPSYAPVLTDRHGCPILRLSLPDAVRATPVDADALPPDLLACTMAAEDKRFQNHGGVDYLATARAARDLFAKRRVVSGASTITQQLIKISSPPTQRGPLRKLYEALAARKLEGEWSKTRILTAYLNRLDYGNQRTGASEAARFYFQKPLPELSLAECALLAGIPQAPSKLNPLKHPERALQRRNLVLKRLLAMGGSDEARIHRALEEPLTLRPLRLSKPAPWLAAVTPPAEDLSENHGKIRTTLDLALQKDIESIVREETAKLRASNLRHAAVVVIDNPSGEILALVSSADWNDPRGGQINGALAPRSPGSALKPFTYLLAIGNNQRLPSSIVADIPSAYRTPQGVNLPENYDRAYRGPVLLRNALACSLNVPAMRELNALGGPAPLHRLLTQLGLTTLGKDPNAYGLGLTIGNAPVRLLELTNAYATLARLGKHLPPALFPSPPNKPAEDLQPSGEACFLIADILSDPEARAASFPRGGPLDLPFRCAVKTGTSSDFKDNWCLGYTPQFTVGVWAGNFENQPMKGLSGVAGAAPIFHRAMVRAHRNLPPTWYPRPGGLAEITVDDRNGKRIGDETPNPHAHRDLCPINRMPPAATHADYAAEGKSLLDPAYTAWFDSAYNVRRAELALDPAPRRLEPLRVITPVDGTTLLLDPEIPSGSDKLRPVTNLPGTARWSSPTLRIEAATPEPVVHLTPGTHTLTATDPRTGESRNLTLHVKTL